jgi:hypothetical protein
MNPRRFGRSRTGTPSARRYSPDVRYAVLSLALVGCASHTSSRPVTPLRAACPPEARWDGASCVPRTATSALTAAAAAARDADVPGALAALTTAAAEPLALADHIRLWELRGTVHSYLAFDAPDDPAPAAAAHQAFERLLAIAPEHHLSCEEGSKASLRFERTRRELAERAGRELEITWPRTTRVGQPIPIDLETVADPARVLHRLELFSRVRGETTWRVADVALPAPGARARIYLPAVATDDDTAIELYGVATDPDGNQTLAWAAPTRPREVPLRFDPPTPWYRKWWVWAIAGGAVAVGAGVTTYALTWSPSGSIGGEVQP